MLKLLSGHADMQKQTHIGPTGVSGPLKWPVKIGLHQFDSYCRYCSRNQRNNSSQMLPPAIHKISGGEIFNSLSFSTLSRHTVSVGSPTFLPVTSPNVNDFK